MIVVVNDFVGPLVRIATHPGATLPGFEEGAVSSDRLDVTVYHVSYWRRLIEDNVVRLLLCSGIPKAMVLKEALPLTFKVGYQRSVAMLQLPSQCENYGPNRFMCN